MVGGSCDGRGVLGHVGGHVLDHVMGWGVAGSCDRVRYWVTCGIICWTISEVGVLGHV